MPKPQCVVLNLGLLEYARAWALQRTVMDLVRRSDIPAVLILVEHPHVYTLGRRGRRSDIFLDDGELARLGVEVHQVDRGGEVTYHGPGQAVAYPILNLRAWGGPVRYVRSLEEVLIRTLADFGVAGHAVQERPGVWVGEEKIAFIGVAIRGGVTCHGVALNVSPDLTFFRHIVPCGIPHLAVTSMARLLGGPLAVDEVNRSLVRNLGQVMGLDMADGEALEHLVDLKSRTRTD